MAETDDHANSDSRLEVTASVSPDSADVAGRRVDPLTREDAQTLIGTRYRIESEARHGGMGRVFRATDTVLRREVAIKMLLSKAERGADGAPSPLLAEARMMAKLRHPYLCPVHEVVIEGPAPFLVMEWIDGVPLDDAWRHFDLHGRLRVLMRLLEGVAELHAQGLVHGDLKPRNVLVDRRGDPIVVDFGLSSSTEDADDPVQRGGTPGFSPPEQFDAGHSFSPRMDVYALGVILYMLMTDRRPFEARTLKELLESMRHQAPPLPEHHAPDAPWPLQRIALVAMEQDPIQRYPDAHAMSQDLQRFLRGETVAARPSYLVDEFREKVELQIEDVSRWRRQGLVTEREGNRLAALLGRLLRPESHWILDSRRLTISQVTLYLGGWLVLLAMSIGITMSWDALSAYPSSRYTIACVTAGGLIGIGLMLQRREQRRFALGYQMTGCLLVPVAVWLVLKEMDWLGTPMTESVTAMTERRGEQTYTRSLEWFDVFMVPVVNDDGVLNRQILVISLAWLVVASILRWMSRASALTPFAVVAAGVTGAAAWASVGFLTDEHRNIAYFGTWLAGLGFIAIPWGLRLNRVEERQIVSAGWSRSRRHDAWAVSSGALVLLVSGLALAAWNAGDLYTFGLRDDPTDPSTRAWAFMINGAVLQLCGHLFARRETILRERLGEVIRWLTPSHFLAAVAVLQVHAEDDMWLVWLVVLILGAVVFTYLSVVRQWKPFLITGLAYLVVAYLLAYREAYDRLEDDPLETVELLLMCSVLVAGVVMMVLAWQIPNWRSEDR